LIEFKETFQFANNNCVEANVSLSNRNLWMRFHVHTTEMIITKQGRRMFPTLQYVLAGLDVDKKYNVFVDIVLCSNNHWKFQAGKWIASGLAEQAPPGRFFLLKISPIPNVATKAYFLHLSG
jgi:hypothetical protein